MTEPNQNPDNAPDNTEGGSIQDPNQPNTPDQSEPAPTEQPATEPAGTGVAEPPQQ